MDLNELSPELQQKLRSCETSEELLAIVKEEGLELTDEQIESVSGGLKWMSTDHCNTDWDDWEVIGD